ncbi:MAG: hypothetical protein M0002_07265 [Rhodospirillales bacterium]|nr:hypothetical protein [Rhodospirillales bacterium]
MMRALLADDRAVAAVEFASIATVFLLTIFAIIEFSLFGANQLALARGLEAALRYGVVNGTTACGSQGASALQAPFNAAAGPLVTGSLPAIAVACSPAGSDSPGTTLTISANLSWSPVVFASDFPTATIAKSVSGVILH